MSSSTAPALLGAAAPIFQTFAEASYSHLASIPGLSTLTKGLQPIQMFLTIICSLVNPILQCADRRLFLASIFDTSLCVAKERPLTPEDQEKFQLMDELQQALHIVNAELAECELKIMEGITEQRDAVLDLAARIAGMKDAGEKEREKERCDAIEKSMKAYTKIHAMFTAEYKVKLGSFEGAVKEGVKVMGVAADGPTGKQVRIKMP